MPLVTILPRPYQNQSYFSFLTVQSIKDMNINAVLVTLATIITICDLLGLSWPLSPHPIRIPEPFRNISIASSGVARNWVGGLGKH